MLIAILVVPQCRILSYVFTVMCHPHDAAAVAPPGHPELVEPTNEPPPKHVLITIAMYSQHMQWTCRAPGDGTVGH